MNICEQNLVPDIYLKPGEAVISEKAAIVSTVLGSCISLTMFNIKSKIGAICHNLLPVCRDKSMCNDNCHEAFRYVECTIQRMVSEFTVRGIKKSEIEVKLFGGSDMFKISGGKNNSATVGKQNVETALKILSDLGIRVAAADTGGSRGRKIIFCTQTGQVFLKRLNKTEIQIYDVK